MTNTVVSQLRNFGLPVPLQVADFLLPQARIDLEERHLSVGVRSELPEKQGLLQPTLTIRPGFPVQVMVNKDLMLQPYHALFFERTSAQ